MGKMTMVAVEEHVGYARHEELRRMLIDSRRELLNQVHTKMRDVRASDRHRPPTDPADAGEVEDQDDLELVLLQMKSAVLNKIDEAIRRVDEGTYGYCIDCADEIAASRLRALPFAVRCKDCEESREHSDLAARVRARRVSAGLPFEARV